MILTSLDIDALRGMSRVQLPELSRFSLIVGANNAGKSTVLEAAALLLRPVDPSQWVQVARQRDFDMTLVDGIWSLFPSGPPLDLEDGPKQSKPLMISGALRGHIRKLSASGLASQSWDSETTSDITLRVEAKVDAQTRPPIRHTMEFRRDAQAAFGQDVEFYRCFTITPATHRSTRNLVEHLSKAVDAGHKPLVVELLQMFDPDVRALDISASGGRESVKVTHSQRGVVDLASFGDGMRRSAALALALARSSDGLLLIDELEAGIHPRALKRIVARLLSAAEQANVQIISTSHSLEALDAVVEATQSNPAASSLFHLRRDAQQTALNVRRYGGERIHELRESGLDLL